MKNKIISVLLGITIVLSTILQPIVVRANPVVYVGGGTLFLLLTTALAHAGYQIEDESSANYIYNFFFKKYGITDEELKAIAEDNNATMISWDDFQKKLCNPIDSNYPSLKDVFYKKTTNVGTKIGVKCGNAFKKALDRLVEDAPGISVKEFAPCDVVTPITSFPVNLQMSFPIFQLEEDDTTQHVSSPMFYVDVQNPTSVPITVYLTIDDKKCSINVPANTSDRIMFVSWAYNVISTSKNYACLTFKNDFALSTSFSYLPTDYTVHNLSLSISRTGLIFGDLYSSVGLIDIPFNEGSKATYNDNKAIWETLGSIETTLDGLVDMPLTDVDSYADSLGLTFPLDKTAVDTWEQTREDVEIKTQEEVKEETNVITPEITLDGIYDNSGKLTDKFPFCIPFDIAKCITGFSRTGNPVVKFSIPFPYVENFDINIDLSDYETPLTILRFFELLGFILGILILTRNIIKG